MREQTDTREKKQQHRGFETLTRLPSLIAHNTLTLHSLWTLAPFELPLINFVYTTGGWSHLTDIIMTLYYLVTVNRSGFVFVYVLSFMFASFFAHYWQPLQLYVALRVQDDFTTFLLAHSVLKMPCDHQHEWKASWIEASLLGSYLSVSGEERSPGWMRYKPWLCFSNMTSLNCAWCESQKHLNCD